jgi:OOP family OmpA-OmpF porin
VAVDPEPVETAPPVASEPPPPPEAPVYHGPPLRFPGFEVDKGKIKLPRQVRFVVGSPEILPDADPVLERIVRFMNAFPKVTLLRVEAHTDLRGMQSYNEALARSRALSVAAWLVAHGVDCHRLLPVAPSERPALVCNTCPPGPRPNRRIEFHVALVDGAAPYGPPMIDARAGDPCHP